MPLCDWLPRARQPAALRRRRPQASAPTAAQERPPRWAARRGRCTVWRPSPKRTRQEQLALEPSKPGSTRPYLRSCGTSRPQSQKGKKIITKRRISRPRDSDETRGETFACSSLADPLVIPWSSLGHRRSEFGPPERSGRLMSHSARRYGPTRPLAPISRLLGASRAAVVPPPPRPQRTLEECITAGGGAAWMLARRRHTCMSCERIRLRVGAEPVRPRPGVEPHRLLIPWSFLGHSLVIPWSSAVGVWSAGAQWEVDVAFGTALRADTTPRANIPAARRLTRRRGAAAAAAAKNARGVHHGRRRCSLDARAAAAHVHVVRADPPPRRRRARPPSAWRRAPRRAARRCAVQREEREREMRPDERERRTSAQSTPDPGAGPSPERAGPGRP